MSYTGPIAERNYANQNTGIDVQALKAGTVSTVSVSSSSAQSSAHAATTNVIRLVSTTDCHIAFAASPTATTSSMYLPANQVEYFLVTGGEKVAAIRASADGTLYVTEMA